MFKIDFAMISMAESKVADSIYKKSPLHKIDVMDIIRVVNPKKLFSSKEIAYINYDIEEWITLFFIPKYTKNENNLTIFDKYKTGKF